MLNSKPLKAPTRNQEVTLLIDADYWTYMMAALCQHKTVQPDKSTTAVENSEGDIVHVEPVEHLHYLVHHALTELKNRFMTDDLEIYLTGTGNYREEIAVTKPYKGQRTKAKPYYYQEVRDYLVGKYEAEIIDGEEADDVVAIRQMQCMAAGRSSVIVSPDKDLKCMFGYNFNPRTKELTHILPHEAAAHFYRQMITGDTVDNIPGCQGRGKAFADKMFASLPIVHNVNDIRVTTAYVEAIINEVSYAYDGKGHDIDYYLEQGRLLHMRRNIGEMWGAEYDWFRGYRDLRPVMMIEDDE